MSKQDYSNLGDFGDGLEFSISKPNQENMDTEVLKAGTYQLPEDCTASVVKGEVIVYQKRKSVLKEGDYRCKDCRFNIIGYATNNARYSTYVCLVNRKNMGSYGAMKVLHDMQKWRRGRKMPMVSPILFGAAIDVAISVLRKDLRTTQKLKEDGQERSNQEPAGGGGQV